MNLQSSRPTPIATFEHQPPYFLTNNRFRPDDPTITSIQRHHRASVSAAGGAGEEHHLPDITCRAPRSEARTDSGGQTKQPERNKGSRGRKRADHRGSCLTQHIHTHSWTHRRPGSGTANYRAREHDPLGARRSDQRSAGFVYFPLGRCDVCSDVSSPTTSESDAAVFDQQLGRVALCLRGTLSPSERLEEVKPSECKVSDLRVKELRHLGTGRSERAASAVTPQASTRTRTRVSGVCAPSFFLSVGSDSLAVLRSRGAARPIASRRLALTRAQICPGPDLWRLNGSRTLGACARSRTNTDVRERLAAPRMVVRHRTGLNVSRKEPPLLPWRRSR
ncbi:hypothetical protein AOLI_G00164180 [Acnodon oligacanthus]